jgi:hypothetical protein
MHELIQDSNKLPKINQANTQIGIIRNSIKTIHKIIEKIIPKRLDDRIILRIKSTMVIGDESIHSRFFSRVSQGNITGLIAELVKNMLIPKIPLKN